MEATHYSRRAGRRSRLKSAGAVAVLAGLAGVFLWLGSDPRTPTAATQPSMDDLLAAMIRGDARAVERAQAACAGDPARRLALAARAVSEANWQARAAGCALLAGQRDAATVALLVPRVSDADGRVRMVAIGALARMHPPPQTLPQKFTAIDERDAWLLAWIDDYSARTGSRLRDELCEVYAPAVRVEFGRPLAGRCLTCHAGRSPAAMAVNDICAGCHAAVYGQWEGSAHAQSLSHLHLLTPSPSGPDAQWMTFGAVHGINCTECHVSVGRRASSTWPATRPNDAPGTQPAAGCAYAFALTEPAAASCERCHASIQAEWMIWRAKPHARRTEWPPGQVDLDVEGDTRGCVDCHMARALPGEPRDHRWAARRAPEMLAAALGVQVAVAEDGDAAMLTITNLTGHALPAGTRRRAIRVYAGMPEGDALPLVASWSLDTPDGPAVAGGPLAPGERRTVQVPLVAGVRAVAYRVVFVRDHYDPAGFTAEMCAGVYRLPEMGRP